MRSPATAWKYTLPRTFILDDLIRSGNVAAARSELSTIRPAEVPRESATELASLAWRVGMFELGLRLLGPYVRGVGARRRPAPAPCETLWYGGCLIGIGAEGEGLGLLETLRGSGLAEVGLLEAAGLVRRWEYGRAIPLLEAYRDAAGVPEYQRLVAGVNLCAALVFEARHDEADALLEALLPRTRARERLRLHGNLLLLAGENALLRRDLEKTRAFLDAAERVSRNNDAFDGFLVRKWWALHGLFSGERDARARLNAVLQEARARRHWETLRTCHRYLALAERDERLLLRVLAGTPFPPFRAKLCREWGAPLALPPHFDWVPGDEGEPASRFLDVGAGEDERGERVFKPGQAPHRLLAALCSDFFRPYRVAALHAVVYPDEHFNPDSSSARVYQAISRLRALFRRLEVPLDIVESEDGYRLLSRQGYVCRVPLGEALGSEPGDPAAWSLQQLRRLGRTFTRNEAAERLGISPRSATRLLGEATRSGTLEASRSGKTVRYRFR